MNPGPHGPEPCALPNCASPRLEVILSGAVSTHGFGVEVRWRAGPPSGGLVAYRCWKEKAPADENPHAVFRVVHRDFRAA